MIATRSSFPRVTVCGGGSDCALGWSKLHSTRKRTLGEVHGLRAK